ncbi:MAG: hypothetical protein EP297_05430 [Gammaproteobacteria bacterium]|nr:MAG: hypothetical protein EP297_05430 [Gammaproteobacteria bacterium]
MEGSQLILLLNLTINTQLRVIINRDSYCCWSCLNKNEHRIVCPIMILKSYWRTWSWRSVLSSYVRSTGIWMKR